MSYVMIDAQGKVADLASNEGIKELEESGLPVLQDFSHIAVAVADMEGDIEISNGVQEEQ